MAKNGRDLSLHFGLGALGLLVALGALLVLASAPSPPEPVTLVQPPSHAATSFANVTRRGEPAHARTPLDYGDDGVPIKPHDPSDPEPEGPMHPHPITPKHLRIYRENNLLGQLDGAVAVKDAAGVRRLLEQYRAEYPENEHFLQEGYEVILDCFEHPGTASRAAAQLYYDTQTSSTLRRYVRRHCLEPST